MTLSCDIFCTIVDNFGDGGVCWRLARQLAVEYKWQVRLWIDDITPIGLFSPAQQIVDVHRWAGDFAGIETADVVIETFACTLPPAYIQAMVLRNNPPVWLNLEYLTAEDWVTGCHGLPSPQAGLKKYFFFPGFNTGTGGLLKEQNYTVLPQTNFDGPLEVSLFCYNNPLLTALLEQWRDGDRPILCHVTNGLPRRQVESWLGESLPARRGLLQLETLPFLPHVEYDALLQRCHLNFVRGEDSFVRAQWAERPFVWQIYPQADDAHRAKLEAFLQRYTDDAAARNFFRAWNGNGPLDWPAFAARLPALAARAPEWANRIADHGDLAGNLVNFCASRL